MRIIITLFLITVKLCSITNFYVHKNELYKGFIEILSFIVTNKDISVPQSSKFWQIRPFQNWTDIEKSWLLMIAHKFEIYHIFAWNAHWIDRILWKLLFCLAFEGLFSHFKRTDTNLDTWGKKDDTDTDTDTF